MATTSSSPFLARLFGVIFVATGVVVAFFVGKPILDNAQASAAWPKAAGRIVSSQVAEGTTKGKKRYWADVHYAFVRDGREFAGKTVSFGASQSADRQSHEAVVARYPVGKEVDIYYNPDQPEVSVLEPGATLASYFVFVLGLVFLVAGAVFTAAPLFKSKSKADVPAC